MKCHFPVGCVQESDMRITEVENEGEARDRFLYSIFGARTYGSLEVRCVGYSKDWIGFHKIPGRAKSMTLIITADSHISKNAYSNTRKLELEVLLHSEIGTAIEAYGESMTSGMHRILC